MPHDGVGEKKPQTNGKDGLFRQAVAPTATVVAMTRKEVWLGSDGEKAGVFHRKYGHAGRKLSA